MLAYYGLGNESSPATFAQVGHRLGLSKGRVRQIQRDALRKLRDAAGLVA
jgi:DNA-directed RNA polymerase sigma subunit (sigma70/sigma32)